MVRVREMCFEGPGLKTVMQLEARSRRSLEGSFESGSKRGADTFMQATTNQRVALTLKDNVEDTNIPVEVNAVCELVINGIDIDAVAAATKAGIAAAVKIPGIKKIAARNYGGSLGAFKVNLGDLL